MAIRVNVAASYTAGRAGARDRIGGRRALLASLAALPLALLVLGPIGQASATAPLPGSSRGATVAHPVAPLARGARSSGEGLVPSSFAKAFHPEHATPGVLALRGEPLRSPAGAGSSRHQASAFRSAAPVAPAKPRINSCPVPSAPGGVGASAGANQVTVTWTAAEGNGTTVDAYVVREATGPDAGASIATDGSATTAVLTGLAGGTAATFSVVAESSCGTGPAGISPAATPTGSSSTYLGSVLADTPTGFYRLDEPSGTVMADSSGNAADGSYSGQESLGAAAALGSDSATSTGYATCCSGLGSASPTLPLYNTARTVEVWVDTTSATANQAILGYGLTNTDEAFIVSISAQAISVDGYNDYLEFPTPRPVDNGTWHLITVTYNGSTVDAYLDGQLVGDAPFAGTVNTNASSGFSLATFSGYNFFNGDMADVAVYPSALSAARVEAHFAASGYGRPTAAVDLNAFYGGTNGADVTWGQATASDAPVTGYLVSAVGSGSARPSVAVGGDATAARLSGLAPGTYTFQVVAMDSFGNGPVATTAAFGVTGSASTYASRVLSSDPSVFYRLADSTPTAMADSSGNGATGAYDPSSTLSQPGPLANDASSAIADNAGGPAAESVPTTLPLYAQPRTLEGWIDTTSGGEEWVAGYGITSTDEGFAVAVQPNDVYVSGYSDDLSFTSSSVLNDGQWHFIVVTTNSVSATAYVDGVSLGTETFARPLDTLPAPQGFFVGADAQGCCGYFLGDLADVAVLPSALTAAQVTAQFGASGLGRPPAPINASATAGANQATVSWTSPPGSDPAVTGYLVTALKAGAAANAVSVPASATSTTVTGLSGATSYTFEIQGLNEYGAGATATTAAVTPTGSATTYASTVLSLGPSVFYRLGDSNPTAMADSSGNGATGVYDPASTLGEPGPLANDVSSGIADNADGPAAQGHPSPLPLYAQPRTLEGWVDTTGAGLEWLAGYGTTSSDDGFALAVQPDDVYVSGYSDDLSFTSTSVLNDGHWHFIVVTANAGSATVYVDGVSIGTQTFPHGLDTLPASQGLLVGSDVEGCCGYFQGDLADVAVFPSALTAAQVTAEFAASGLGRPSAPTNATATAGANEATVSWTAPTGADPAVTGYLVTAHKGAAAANAVSVLASATSATVTGLVGGASYTFKVQALNEYGAGATATTAAVKPTGSASTYASTVLSLGPSVFYRLGDSTSAALADSSGNGATGVYDVASTLGEPGPLANDVATAVGDNGDGPAAQADPSTLPLYAQPRTLEGWIDTTSTGEEFLAGYGTTTTSEGFAVAVQPSDVVASGYGDDLSFASPSVLDDGHWHFIVVTTNGTSATVYVDGVSIGTQNFPESLDTQPAPPGFLVGAGVQGCCGGFQGDLADMAVIPSALTAAQVTAQFAASGLGRPPAPTAAKATKGANQATVSWTAPAGSDPAVTGYLVTALTGGAAANAISVPASATSTIVTGLAGATSYTFEVQALNEYGAGATDTTAAVKPTGSATTYASTVLSSGPSVFYRLGDSAPTAMADSSGNGATGAYNPSSTLSQPGPLANDPSSGISDNGDGPAGQAGPSSLPYYAEPRTLEGWIDTTSGGQEWLAGYGTTSSDEGFAVSVQPSDVYISGYGDDLSFASSSALNDGHWHFIVVTTNSVSATAYVDGVSLGTETFPRPLDTLPAPQGFLVGSDAEGCCGDFQGDLADVAVLPSVLTAAQVTSEFAASGLGRPPAPTGAKATKGANQATVSWTAPAGSDPVVTGYLVTALKSGAAANAVSVPASATSTIVTGLAGATSYTFEVQALNEYGAGATDTTASVKPTGSATTYASTVLSLGPSVFYRLGDSTPAALADSSGHAATGVYDVASTLGQPGPLANDPATAVGDNANGPAAQSHPSSLPLYAQPRTLEGWIDTTSGGAEWLAGYGSLSTDQGFTVAVQPNDVYVSGYSDDLTFSSSAALNDGHWHFIVVTTNGVSATAYVDGVSLGTETFPHSLDTLPAPQGFVVGSYIEGCCGYFQGDLADVAVFPSALTAAQVTAQESAATAAGIRHEVPVSASLEPMTGPSDVELGYGRIEYLLDQPAVDSTRSETTRTRSQTARTRVTGGRS